MDTKSEELLRVTLVHEFRRCTRAYNYFVFLLVYLPQKNTKEQRLEIHDCYSDFIAHLYEFYLGHIERNKAQRNKWVLGIYDSLKGKTDADKVDAVMNAEVEKLFRNIKNRILHGVPGTDKRELPFYDCEIPEAFGRHFRFVRNRRNHVIHKRASDEEISLTDFYKKYHKFIIVLYDECKWLWQVKDEEFDWKDIDSFATEIQRH